MKALRALGVALTAGWCALGAAGGCSADEPAHAACVEAGEVGDAGACAACTHSKCCAEANACEGNSGCVALMKCEKAGDPVCLGTLDVHRVIYCTDRSCRAQHDEDAVRVFANDLLCQYDLCGAPCGLSAFKRGGDGGT